ncbi:hypothetical protein IL306_004410 [Fusarium sp. DS 682]|nr:hypothetical protein IL306_004410 [Fusarium sp. DS 682]
MTRFDDSSLDISPWTGEGLIIQDEPQSGPRALALYFAFGGGYDLGVKQTLTNLNGNYRFSYSYRVLSASFGADYTCELQLKIGDTTIRGDMDSSVGGWKSSSQIWSSNGENVAEADVELNINCGGEFEQVRVNIDSLSFKQVCST